MKYFAIFIVSRAAIVGTNAAPRTLLSCPGFHCTVIETDPQRLSHANESSPLLPP